MLLIYLLQDMPTWVAHIGGGGDMGQGFLWSSQMDWSVLAQQFETDVFAGFRAALNNFIQTGQVWALIIGFIIGYLVRSLTTYG